MHSVVLFSRKQSRYDPVFAKAHDEIPWQVMYAMRNRLSHGYDKIDYDMVWKTVCNDLPELYALVKSAKAG